MLFCALTSHPLLQELRGTLGQEGLSKFSVDLPAHAPYEKVAQATSRKLCVTQQLPIHVPPQDPLPSLETKELRAADKTYQREKTTYQPLCGASNLEFRPLIFECTCKLYKECELFDQVIKAVSYRQSLSQSTTDPLVCPAVPRSVSLVTF